MCICSQLTQSHNVIGSHNTWQPPRAQRMCTRSQLTDTHTPCSQLTHTTAHTTPWYELDSVRFCVMVCLTRLELNIVIGLQWSFAIRWKSDLWHGAVKFRYAHDHNVNEAFYHMPLIRSKTPTIRFHGLCRFEWNQGRWGMDQFPSQNAHICETFSENRSNEPHRGPYEISPPDIINKLIEGFRKM